jgi:DNA helicase-2/ATP-dependent DNA helicase PcrA
VSRLVVGDAWPSLGRVTAIAPLARLTWTIRAPERGWLRTHGFAVLAFDELCEQFVVPARRTGTERSSIDSPAQPLLERFATHDRVAVLGVRLNDLEDLRSLYGYAMEPAWRAGCALLIDADRTLEQLDAAKFVDERFEYPWTLERARWLAAVMAAAAPSGRGGGVPLPSRSFDPQQLYAVAAHDGVVQVIAPAGSGKTTVLVERVRELLRRGTHPERILCMTFNAAAAAELRERLSAAGVTSVEARTFHSVGRGIGASEGVLRGQPRQLSLPQWRRLCAIAQSETGRWIDPPDARAFIAEVKLGHLLSAAEWSSRLAPDDDARTLARIYELYEAEQRRAGQHDFDDQIMLTVRALRSDAALRARWQAKFERVLVDEYQDIEPAQELLVQILAAPEDSLLCVGDEDQVLYGWRRASAERMIALDQTYPGLRRVALATNYRCPPEAVGRSAQLVAHNTLRFRKTILPRPGRIAEPGAICLHEHATPEAGAAWSARTLSGAARGEIVVLARTTRLLRRVAEACVEPGVMISAPDAVFDARGAPAVIEAHLRLATRAEDAKPEDVLIVMRQPARGLALGAEQAVAERLRAGDSWQQALRRRAARDETRLQEAAVILETLRAITDAPLFIRTLRGLGGLDEHFEQHERTFGGVEEIDTEQLDDAEREATGRTVAGYAGYRRARRDALLAIRDQEHGIELTTVHRAKGREWPTVIVFGFDDGQLPHHRALDISAELAARGEALEAERRVAYVALTRAKDRVHVFATQGNLSPFAWEAGLTKQPTPAPRRQRAEPRAPEARSAPPPPRPRKPPTGPPGSDDVTRVGARYALRASATRAEGMRIAAWAIQHSLRARDPRPDAPRRQRDPRRRWGAPRGARPATASVAARTPGQRTCPAGGHWPVGPSTDEANPWPEATR